MHKIVYHIISMHNIVHHVISIHNITFISIQLIHTYESMNHPHQTQHTEGYNQGSLTFEPPPELLKRLWMKSFPTSSEATYEGYTMRIRVVRKMQSKVKSLEANLLWIFSWHH
jgi:hypothetical protein